MFLPLMAFKASTDVNGQFQIIVPNNEAVVIQKKGYESELINKSDLDWCYYFKKITFSSIGR